LIEAKKRVPDDALAQITEVVASFSTPFKPSQRDRSVNLRTAATKLDGIVLMPGETLSFNETVGKRTVENGYREAIVFEEGRQTPGVGGGICQVSSTLYNAALLANMEIVQRRNHSIPVPYVSLGRDATVYWGAVDLVLKNNYPVPLAVSADYQPGRLTFRILGRRTAGQKVVIESGPVRAFPPVVRTVADPSLAPGARKVRSRGSGGRSVSTWRVVYQDGRLVKREPLGTSRYRGEVQIVAVGPSKTPTPADPPPVAESANGL
jgi:vancomycin resistance protein YoaR